MNLPHPLGPFIQKATGERKDGVWEYKDTKKRVGQRLAEILSAKEWRGSTITIEPFWWTPPLPYSVWLQEPNKPRQVTGLVIRRKMPDGVAEIRHPIPIGVPPEVYLRELLALIKWPKLHKEQAISGAYT